MPDVTNHVERLYEMADQGLGSLPWSAHAVVGLAFIVGLIVWLFGQSMLRTAFAVVAMVTGAMLGLLLPAAAGLVISPAITALIGGIAGLLVGAMLFRLTVSLSMGLVLAMVAPLVALGVMRITGPPAAIDSPVADAIRSLGDTIEGPLDDYQRAAPVIESASPVAAEIRHAAERIADFLDHLWDQVRPHWEALAGSQRTVVVLSILAGMALGALAGSLMPKRAASVITACVGAAIMLPAAAWLVGATGARVVAVRGFGPLAWVGFWALLAVIGSGVQLTRSRRRADNR